MTSILEEDSEDAPLPLAPWWLVTLRGLMWGVLTPLWLWALMAIWFFDLPPLWVRIVTALGWGTLIPVGFVFLPRIPVVIVVLIGVSLVRFFWSYQIPSNERDWALRHEKLPVVLMDTSTVHIQNMRNAQISDADAMDEGVKWYSQRYNLKGIVKVDLISQPITVSRPVAHTLLSFGFRNGDHVAVSIEARCEKGETYNPLKSFFKQYELMYVFGDERDLIGRRAIISGDPIFVFPLRLTPHEGQVLFQSLIKEATKLYEEPTFYDPLLDNCTMRLINHFEKVTAAKIQDDWRAKVPGYADTLIFDLGLIATVENIDETRKHAYVNHRTAYLEDGRQWSKQIRGRLKKDE